MSMYIIYFDPKHSGATIVELLEFTVFMPDPVLNSIERRNNGLYADELPLLFHAQSYWLYGCCRHKNWQILRFGHLNDS